MAMLTARKLPLGTLKRRLLVGGFVLAAIATGVAAFFHHPTTRIGGVGAFRLPLVAFCVGFVVLVAAMRMRTRSVQSVALLVGASVLTVNVVDTLVVGAFTNADFTRRMVGISPWIAPTFLLIFLTLEPRVAIRLGVALSTIFSAAVCVHLLVRDPSTIAPHEWNALAQQFVLGNGLMLMLLYYLARTRESAARARSSRASLVRLAFVDELTGIANRRRVLSACRAAIRRRAAEIAPSCVILFDVDHFKDVNDSHGHEVGDAVLRKVVDTVSNELRYDDELGRIGGEEFVVVARKTRLRDALVLAERLRAAVERRVGTPPLRGALTASFGVTEVAPGDTLESLLGRADAALYAAKSHGRNCVMSEQALDRTPAPQGADVAHLHVVPSSGIVARPGKKKPDVGALRR